MTPACCACYRFYGAGGAFLKESEERSVRADGAGDSAFGGGSDVGCNAMRREAVRARAQRLGFLSEMLASARFTGGARK